MPVNNPVVQERLRRLEQLPQFQSLPPEAQRRYREEAERRWMAEARPPEAPSATRAPERGPGPLGWPFELAGRLDVAQGLKTPEEARRRAREYGEMLGETALWSALPSKATATLLRRLGVGAVLAILRGLFERKTGRETAQDVAIRTLTQLPLEVATPAGARVAESVRGARLARRLPAIQREAAASVARDVADDLKQLVPWLQEFPSSIEGLHDMLFVGGHRRMVERYGQMLRDILHAIPEGHQTPVPARVALSRVKGMTPEVLAQVNPEAMVPVPTHELIERWIPTIEDPQVRQQLLDSTVSSLGQIAEGLAPAYRDARRQYAVWRGVKEFMDQHKVFGEAGRSFDVEQLRKGLSGEGIRPLRERGIESIMRSEARYPGTPEALGLEQQPFPWMAQHALALGGGSAAAEGLRALGVPWGLSYPMALAPAYWALYKLAPGGTLYRLPLAAGTKELLRRVPGALGGGASRETRRLVESSPESSAASERRP